MSLLEKLKAGAANTRMIKFPGTDQDVLLRVLTNGEKQAAAFGAERHFRLNDIEISTTTYDLYEDEINTWMLSLALRDPDNPQVPFARNADELRRLITVDEKDVLVEEYNALESEVSPNAETLTDEEAGALFEQLKKNPALGNSLNSSTLRRLITYSASRPRP